MKKFIFVVIHALITVLVIQALLISMVDGKTDPFYLRFTKTNSTNLILGTSRVAQGIQPSVLDEILDISSYNFAFTVGHSPFGEVYNRAIFSKLNVHTENQVFVIGVDPWSISSTSDNPNSQSDFRENKSSLANVNEYNETRNIPYIFKYLAPLTIIKSFINKSPTTVLRDDGWLEVNVDMDPSLVEKRTRAKMLTYREKNLPCYKYSDSRKKSLMQLVQRLNHNGEVFLVRLPIHPDMMTIENEMLPFFNDSIKDVIAISSGYLDLTAENTSHTYTDGNHLHKSSGEVVSRKVAYWIKNQ